MSLSMFREQNLKCPCVIQPSQGPLIPLAPASPAPSVAYYSMAASAGAGQHVTPCNSAEVIEGCKADHECVTEKELWDKLHWRFPEAWADGDRNDGRWWRAARSAIGG